MVRVASMPMYDFPEIAPALDELWAGLRRNLAAEGLAEIPRALVHDRDLRALWNDSDLWFSQCCGYDLIARYRGHLRPLATPHYGAPECRGWEYASVVVVAEDREGEDIRDLAGTRCAVNGLESHSGTHSLRALVAPHHRAGKFFASVVESGAHIHSLAMIRRGNVDVAAIDCVTYALLERHRPSALAGVRRFALTSHAPGIPYVTHATTSADDVSRMRAALYETFVEPDLTAVRQALLLEHLETTELAHYQRIAEIAEAAGALGYPKLA